MNRIDFLRNISNNNIKELMCNYFDQNMALYNLIYENIDNLNVSCEIMNQDIYFTISSIRDIELEVLKLNIKNQDIIYCYGKTYNIQMSTSKNQIRFKFNEVVA